MPSESLRLYVRIFASCLFLNNLLRDFKDLSRASVQYSPRRYKMCYSLCSDYFRSWYLLISLYGVYKPLTDLQIHIQMLCHFLVFDEL